MKLKLLKIWIMILFQETNQIKAKKNLMMDQLK